MLNLFILDTTSNVQNWVEKNHNCGCDSFVINNIEISNTRFQHYFYWKIVSISSF